MKVNFFKAFDYFIFFSVLILVTTGIFFIYSSGINSEGLNVSNEFIKQIIWACIGIVLMVFMTFVDYRRLNRFAPFLYLFLVLILIYTKIFGKYVNGARSWLGFGGFGIQPSEFCKIIYIMFLAWYFERTSNEKEFKRFFISVLIFLVPFGLILLQPDLGTASVYIPIFLIMSFVAGVPLRYIFLVLLGGSFTILFAVLPIWQKEIAHASYFFINILLNPTFSLLLIITFGLICFVSILGYIFFPNKRYYYWIAYVSGIIAASLIFSKLCGMFLKDYQIKRLIVFIDPSSDPRGAGWNIIQSKIAIGSGSLFGQGFLEGTQSHYRFLPQQSTDFIFSILAEELGFLGGLFVYFLYFIILMRIINIIKNTSNTFGFYIASGILGMFFFHFIVNVGMVMGIMPITGIPLLFLSYGGSSLLTAMLCVGMLMSINSHKFEF